MRRWARAVAVVALLACGLVPALPGVAAATGPAPGDRAGYLLVMGGFTDAEKRQAYQAALPPIYAAHGGHYLALGAPGRGLAVLAGEFARGLVLARFPDADSVSRFWHSPDYRRAVDIRTGGGSFDVLRLEGAAPPADTALYLLALLPAGTTLPPVAEGRVMVAGAPLETLEGAVAHPQLLIAAFPDEGALDRFLAGAGRTLPGDGGLLLRLQPFAPR